MKQPTNDNLYWILHKCSNCIEETCDRVGKQVRFSKSYLNSFRMKKTILATIVLAFVFIACSSNSKKTEEQTPVENKPADTATVSKPAETKEAEQLYACSMHPEVIGKKDGKCSKCGMKLTVPVKKN